MNRQWRTISTVAVLCTYLLTALVASSWWMAIGNDASLWGVAVASLKKVNFSSDPFFYILFPAVPAAFICWFNQSRAVHIWIFVVSGYQLYHGINYVLNGAYFGCDRNGCSAEENFALGNILTALAAIVGAGLIYLFVRFFKGNSESVREISS